MRTEIEGYYYDDETGECLGPVTPEGFVIDTPEKAEWAMQKIHDADMALKAAEDYKASVLANLDAMVKRASAKAKGTRWRFEPELIQFAKQQLEGGKAKSYLTAYGKVWFKSNPAKWKIEDYDAAVAYALANAPEVLETSYKIKAKPEDISTFPGVIQKEAWESSGVSI